MCTCVFVYHRVCWVAWYSNTDPLARSGPDPDTCLLWSRYTGDSKTDPQGDWRSVPVRVVKTRRRFGFKTVSFHVSVCSCIISSCTVISNIYIYMLRALYHVIICFILPVWLLVPFYVMSVSAHFICTLVMSVIYIISCVVVYRFWFRISWSIP